MTKKTAKKKLVIKKVVKTSKGVIVTDNQVKILEMVYGGCEVGKSYKLMGYFSYTDKPHLSIFRESDDRRLSKLTLAGHYLPVC